LKRVSDDGWSTLIKRKKKLNIREAASKKVCINDERRRKRDGK
jgi:hypothetical protein